VGVVGVTVVAAVVGSACGQYPGVHRDPVVQAHEPAAVTVPLVNASPVSGSGRITTTRVHHPVGDGLEGPENADVEGGSGSVALSEIFKTNKQGSGSGSTHDGSSSGSTKDGSKSSSSNVGDGSQGSDGKGTSSGTGSSGTKKDGKSGHGSRGDDGANPGTPDIEGSIGSGTPPENPLDLASLISRETVEGAKYNSTVLPTGFPFTICPVQGTWSYSDSYGAPRYAGGYHPHAGVDIFAVEGTPIVAPFDGYVERVPNTLGGNAVKVHGAQGYVYMAHLVAYGITEQNVKAGTVVGFVGNTGDAIGTSPHDHFEWHPNHVAAYDRQLADTNGAVDPFAYLQVICPPD